MYYRYKSSNTIKYSELGDQRNYKRLIDDNGFVYYWNEQLNNWYTSFGFPFTYFHGKDECVKAVPRILTDKETYYLQRLLEPYKDKECSIYRKEHDLVIEIKNGDEKRQITLPFMENSFQGMDPQLIYSVYDLDIIRKDTE